MFFVSKLFKQVVLTILLAFASGSMVSAALEFERLSIEGVVDAGAKSFPFIFPFVNTGSQDIHINKIKSSCGCTVAKLDKMVYASGESGVITGEFNVGSRQGVHRNTIRILTDASEQSEILLRIQVTIPQLVELRPELLLWRVDSDPIAKTVSIVPNQEFGVEILTAEADSENFSIELIKAPGSGTAEYQLIVTPLSTMREQRTLVRVQTRALGEKTIRTFFVHALIR